MLNCEADAANVLGWQFVQDVANTWERLVTDWSDHPSWHAQYGQFARLLCM